MTDMWRREPVGVSVYLVTNKVNGKQYVGYTNTIPERRWSSHRLKKAVSAFELDITTWP